MLAFSNDYYGMIFRATQSVELFCAYLSTQPQIAANTHSSHNTIRESYKIPIQRQS